MHARGEVFCRRTASGRGRIDKPRSRCGVLGEHMENVASGFPIPAMTGAELAREVFALRPDKPFLLLSGDLDAPGLRDGALRHVLAKPFSMERLREAVAT